MSDMSPYCSAHDEWLIVKLWMYMYVRYHTANHVSYFGSDLIQFEKRFIVVFTVFYGHGAP